MDDDAAVMLARALLWVVIVPLIAVIAWWFT